jgi:hypothetical protein
MFIDTTTYPTASYPYFNNIVIGGVYRITHYGSYIVTKGDTPTPFSGTSTPFMLT